MTRAARSGEVLYIEEPKVRRRSCSPPPRDPSRTRPRRARPSRTDARVIE